MSDIDVTARFYDEAAARYDAEIDSAAGNVQLRDAFCRHVATHAGDGETIIDFGAGTGTDAAWYAARGHRVIAYDISPRMLSVLQSRCASEIERGSVAAVSGNLATLVHKLEHVDPVAAIAANFAVLNHIADLRPLLETLAPHLADDGVFVASLLNPFYRGDMSQGWWWRSVPSAARGAIRVDGAVTTYRHFRSSVIRSAAPLFDLIEWRGGSTAGVGSTGRIASKRAMLDENFVFAVLRKRR